MRTRVAVRFTKNNKLFYPLSSRETKSTSKIISSKKKSKIKGKKRSSLAGNRTRGGRVRADRVTDYTTRDQLLGNLKCNYLHLEILISAKGASIGASAVLLLSCAGFRPVLVCLDPWQWEGAKGERRKGKGGLGIA